MGPMASPFYIDMGFTLTEIGAVVKVVALVASVIGIFLIASPEYWVPFGWFSLNKVSSLSINNLCPLSDHFKSLVLLTVETSVALDPVLFKPEPEFKEAVLCIWAVVFFSLFYRLNSY